MQKKLLGTLLALCLLFGVLSIAVAAEDHVHSWGKENDSTAKCTCGATATIVDKTVLLNLMAAEDAETLGATYVLMVDKITLESADGSQSPIGDSSTTPFTGTFYGNGKTIEGINISGEENVGLFGYLTGTVQDLTTVTAEERAVTGSGDCVGGIVGFAGMNAKITNCVNKCTVSSTNSANVGGIAGRAEPNAVISNCYNEGSVTGKTSVGGIVGCAKGAQVDGEYVGPKVVACQNSGAVVAKITSKNANVGGIVGYFYGRMCSIENCQNVGKITATRQYAGGIVGQLGAGTVSSCYASATMDVPTGTTSVGDIYGYRGTSNVTVSNCYYKDGDTYKLAGASDSSSDISTLKALLIALNGNKKDGVWVYNSDKSGVALDSNHECGNWTKGSSKHTCPKCEYAEEHDWDTSDNSQHICSVCEKTAAHNFTDSECACGLVQLTITSLTVEDGSLKATFANDLGSDATLDTSEIEVSENAGTYTVSGLKVNGDYVLASGSHTIAAAYIGTVTATVDGEDAGVSIPYIKGMSVEVTLSSPADKEGYDFTGWKVGGTTYATSTFTIPASMTNTDSLVIEAVYTEQTVNENENPNSNINYNNNVGLFIALAAKNSRQCVITYKSTGANIHVFETVKKGTVLQMPEAPIKDGYTFAGWYKDINGTKPFNFNAKITGNVSIYAKWVKN